MVEDVLQVPRLAHSLVVRGGWLRVEEWSQAQLVEQFPDAHQVVFFHGLGQVRDDGERIARVKLRWVRRQNHAHSIFSQDFPQVRLLPVPPNALHETLQRLRPAQIIELRIPRIFQGIHQDHLPFNVLDDTEQQVGFALCIMQALGSEKTIEDFRGRFGLVQSLVTGFLEQRHPQPGLPDSVQRQRQKNAIEYVKRMADNCTVLFSIFHALGD